MKANQLRCMLISLAFGILTLNQAEAQTTGLSGTGSNTDGASTSGTECTHVGGDAGSNNSGTGDYNTNLGFQSGFANTDRDWNTMIGWKAGWYNQSDDNTFLGAETGYNNSGGTDNTFLGEVAGYTNGDGNQNTFVGQQSGYYNNADNNTFLGNRSGFLNTTGTENVCAGTAAAYYNATGSYNTITGFEAGYGSNYNYSNNSFYGYKAGHVNASGGSNTFLGFKSGYSNTTASENNFIGYQSGYSNTTGTANSLTGFNAGYYNATGSYNTITGWEAGKGVTSNNYSYNTFYGYKSGTANTTGTYNAFFGGHSGLNNTASYNTFIGYNSGVTNTSGTNNTILGYVAGYSNSTGINNTCVGAQAGYSNTAGHNTFIGLQAGYANTSGDSNVVIGNTAGDSYANESRCTFVGYGADANANNYTNATALGYGASALGSNTVYVGNSSIGTAWSFQAWTNGSDRRIKNNIQDDVSGLEFIKLLRPVTFNYDVDKVNQLMGLDTMVNATDSLGNQSGYPNWDGKYDVEQVHSSGFIAQEVDSVASLVGYDFNGVDKSGPMMGLRYALFTVPLVKAVQEQQEMIDDLSSENQELNRRLTDLETIISLCCPGAQNRMGNNSGMDEQGAEQQKPIAVELKTDQRVVLYQNEPNPFEGHTRIRFFLPESVHNAYIVFHDEFGIEIKRVEISGKGFGMIEATTENLSVGIFSYSLVVDGNVIDSKKMVKAK